MRFFASRRSLLQSSAASLVTLSLPFSRKAFAEPAASGAEPLASQATQVHGLSVFGDLGLPADFKHFPYVKPDAPKGGTVSRELFGTFNSLNGFILRGDPAAGSDLIFDSLMKNSLDEHDALYGLVAKSVEISADRLTYRFRLRKEARFHDGSPLTAKDAAFSLDILKTKGHPLIRAQLRDLVKAVAEADDILTVTLAEGRSRDLPLLVAGYPIFSAAYYGKHPFEETTLDPPLGSSAYKIGKFDQGRFITYERVADYWAKDLPVNVGQANFDLIRYDYYADRSVAFEGFKAGAFTVHEEFTSANWAKGYDFPALKEGRVIRETIPDENISGIQGWFFNTRRPMFKDSLIREAIGTAFDFKWTNTNLMYGSYERTVSFFENSDMEAKGLPDAEDLALLEPFKDKLPAEVFGAPYIPPESDGSGQPRDLLRKANDLLMKAGCKRRDTIVLLPDGSPFQFEFLYDERGLEPHTQSYIRNLRQLGVQANIRVVDAAQYKQRMDDFDFDVTTERLVMSFSPGEELRSRFGSQMADEHGGRNIVGIKDPVVDALITKALVASSRDELVHICRALDRVLRAGRYWVPHWYKPTHWIAHWDIFGRPEKPPRFDTGIVTTWWHDDAKAKRINFSG
jgi:microcin C transport system substrate-binding protein